MVWPGVLGVLTVVLGFLATSLAAEAQQADRVPRIGIPGSDSAPARVGPH